MAFLEESDTKFPCEKYAVGKTIYSAHKCACAHILGVHELTQTYTHAHAHIVFFL